MSGSFLFPGGVLALHREAAERLLKHGSGDAALLYLSLLSRGDAGGLSSWDPRRMEEAYQELIAIQLADPAQSPLPEKAEKPEPLAPPEYGMNDITMAMKEGEGFPFLVGELQKRLGKILSTSDLQILLTLYDYLAMPAEVIVLLVSWCIEQGKKKYGEGRKPTLPQIRKEAFRWHRQGVDSLEAAESHIQTLTRRGEGAEKLMPLVGIQGRAPVEAERRYLEAWTEMAFEDDAIVLAYEKTVLKKQSMNWPYMNSILKNWHQKGLHKKAEILEKEQGGRNASGSGAGASCPPAEQKDRLRQDMDRLDRLLSQSQDKEG